MNRSSQIFLEYIENLISVERPPPGGFVSRSSGMKSVRIWLSDINVTHPRKSNHKLNPRMSLNWRHLRINRAIGDAVQDKKVKMKKGIRT